MNLSQRIVCIWTLLFLAADPAAAAMNANRGAAPEPNSMIATDKTESQAIPPIDEAVPTDYQTASFGLG